MNEAVFSLSSITHIPLAYIPTPLSIGQGYLIKYKMYINIYCFSKKIVADYETVKSQVIDYVT